VSALLFFLVLFQMPMVVGGYLRALTQSVRRAHEERDGAIVLRYAGLVRATLVLGGTLLLCLGGWLVWPLFLSAPTGTDVYLALGLAPLSILAGCYYFLESRVELLVDENGIFGRTAFRGHRHMPWSRIVDSRFCSVGWLTLRARDGKVLRVPRMLRGFHVLPKIARRNARFGIQEDLLVATEVWGR